MTSSECPCVDRNISIFSLELIGHCIFFPIKSSQHFLVNCPLGQTTRWNLSRLLKNIAFCHAPLDYYLSAHFRNYAEHGMKMLVISVNVIPCLIDKKKITENELFLKRFKNSGIRFIFIDLRFYLLNIYSAIWLSSTSGWFKIW